MSDHLCPCGRPIRDQAVICWPCTNALEKDLAETPALLAEVSTTRLRQGRAGQGNGGRGARDGYDQLPVTAPDEAVTELRTHLVGWTRILVEDQGHQWPQDRLDSLARYLQSHLGYLRRHEAAWDAQRDLRGAVAHLRRTVDRRADRIYAGPCLAQLDDGTVCPEHLSTTRGASVIKCRGCGQEYDPKEQMDWLLSGAEDQLAPASVLAQAVTNLGRAVPAGTIRQWAFRGRLLERGLDLEARPLYRVGDVLDLIAEDAERQARQARAKELDELSRNHGKRYA